MYNHKFAKFKPTNMPNFAFPPTFSPANIFRYAVYDSNKYFNYMKLLQDEKDKHKPLDSNALITFSILVQRFIYS